MRAPLVVKAGGNELSREGWLERLATTLATLAEEQSIVLVHGGGREVDRLLEALQIEPLYAEGQRVTDPATLEAVEMVLSGSVNKRLVRALLAAGAPALGISGVDLGILRVEPWAPELGRVGRIVEVDSKSLGRLLTCTRVLVLSPLSSGPEGLYNVNADHAAGAVAVALGAPLAIFLTDVPGVLRDAELVVSLDLEQVDAWIASGVIQGGMVPKVRAAATAVLQGVAEARITDLAGLAAGTGTSFARSPEETFHR